FGRKFLTKYSVFREKKIYLGEKLVVVSRPVILPPGFPIMTPFTKWLPIAPIPEQFLVATVGDNVIHNRCFGVASLLSAFRTQRVALKERFTCLLPAAAIAALCGRPCYLRVERPVFLTKLCLWLNQFRAARVSTRHFGFLRHSHHLRSQKFNPYYLVNRVEFGYNISG